MPNFFHDSERTVDQATDYNIEVGCINRLLSSGAKFYDATTHMELEYEVAKDEKGNFELRERGDAVVMQISKAKRIPDNLIIIEGIKSAYKFSQREVYLK
ncbi:MAG TPA: hypothetical protein DIV86_03665 [Alphaproteobacteria bacterium]|nr:hypothetical protein [Alphaproteobacteria bacterium]